MNLVTAGTARYLLGERRYDLQRGTLIWLFPEQDHLLLEESHDYVMWIAVITPALLKQVCKSPASKTLLSGDPGQVRLSPLSAEPWASS